MSPDQHGTTPVAVSHQIPVVLACLDQIAVEIEHRAEFDTAAGYDPEFTQAGLSLRLAWRVVADLIDPPKLAALRVPYSTETPTSPHRPARREDQTP